MNYKTTAFLLGFIMLFVGCSDSQTQKTTQAQTKEPLKVEQTLKAEVTPVKEVALKKDYTIAEIYNSMCVECHSPDGSGNVEKLTPSMADLSEQEMYDTLIEVEKDQGHVIMEHNRGQIIKMGMEYSAKDMAEFMFKQFGK